MNDRCLNYGSALHGGARFTSDSASANPAGTELK
jgi:hypothetical protein